MGAKENLAIVEELQQAARDGDWEQYGNLLDEKAVFRMAGVPRTLGGVTEGRNAIVDMLRNNVGGGSLEIRDMFADDAHVCLVGKFSSPRFPGNDFLRPADKAFSTYECVVYRFSHGRVVESTQYVNWLDPYTQVGLVDPASLAR